MEEEDRSDKMFRGVVPGISLTKEPGSYPWERPPEMEDPDKVIQFYLEKFSDEDNISKTMMALEGGFPLRALVEGIMTSGVSRGLHTIDMSMIVAPVVHEFIKGEADRFGIEYDEGLVDEAKRERTQQMYTKLQIIKRMEKIKKEGPKEEVSEVTEEVFEEMPEAEEPVMEEHPVEEPRGLMARRK